MIHGTEHLVVSAIEFVPVEGFCTAAIRGIRFYNHDCRLFLRQNSASDGELMIGKSDASH
jgi:hypothetical protein